MWRTSPGFSWGASYLLGQIFEGRPAQMSFHLPPPFLTTTETLSLVTTIGLSSSVGTLAALLFTLVFATLATIFALPVASPTATLAAVAASSVIGFKTVNACVPRRMLCRPAVGASWPGSY